MFKKYLKLLLDLRNINNIEPVDDIIKFLIKANNFEIETNINSNPNYIQARYDFLLETLNEN